MPDLAQLAQLITDPSQVDPSLAGADGAGGTGAGVTTPGQVDPSLHTLPPSGLPDDTRQIDWAQVPDPPMASSPGLGLGVPQEAAATVKKSGYSDAANRKINAPRGPVARMEAKNAEARDSLNREYAPYIAANETVARNEATAADATGKAEMAKITETAAGKHEIASLYTDFKNKEDLAWQTARVGAEEAKAHYQAAIADFAASKINPSQLWDSASGGDRFGMGVAAFIHGFLGAKGIKTDAMDILNQSIDRNIQAQVANLNTKGQVASQFKQLWDMQREQSASDAEARARVRGFALNSAMQEVEARMGQYDSRLAGAKTMAAKALIQKEQVKNDFTVQQHIDTAHNQEATRSASVLAAELKASSEAAEMASRERIARMTLDAKGKGSNPGDEYEGTIGDVSATGGGLITRKFIKGTPPEKQTELRSKAAAMTSVAEGMHQLKVLQKEAGSRPDFLGDSRLMGEAKRTAKALESYLQLALAYAKSGKQISDDEIEKYERFFKDDTWFTNGDNVRQLSTVMGRLIDDTNTEISGNTHPIGRDDPAFGKSLGRASFIHDLKVESEVDSSADGGKRQQTRTDRAVAALGRPDANEPASGDWKAEGVGGGKSISDAWKNYQLTKSIDDNPNLPPAPPMQDVSEGADETKRRKMAEANAGKPTAAFVAMDILRQEAEKDDRRAKDLLDQWAHLSSIAPGQAAPDGSDPNSPATQEKLEFALYEYKLLSEHERNATK